MSAHVLALTVDVRIPSARSLKDRRAVLSPVLAGARRRFPVAASETGDDRRQRAELSFAAVSGSVTRSLEIIDAVERFVWSFPELEVVAVERAWLEVG